MNRFVLYLILIFLVIYIISPWDIHPHIFDDVAVFGVLYYLWSKYKKFKRVSGYFYSGNKSQDNKRNESKHDINLDEAYRLLGVSPNNSWDEIQKAYKDKIAKSHPDKVAHLSEELQRKAKELTLQLNRAIDIVKRHKKV